jgi:NADH dehydrogenase [ubiquinone] 1 alpha subcomplex assembly factor 7
MPSPLADSADGAQGGLRAELSARIDREGPIRVDQFMEACHAHPLYGYRHNARSIGAGGDFITAPEISQVFGELIGLWSAVVWETMGRPAPLRLVELGPGRGTLMRDALRAGKAMPGFLSAVSVHPVEISEPMRRLQRAALLRSDAGTEHLPAVTWHESLGEVPEGPAIVVANEFLDALPIRQLVHDGRSWRERMVALDPGGRLAFAAGETVELRSGLPTQQGAIVELRAGEDELLTVLAARSAPHVALLIDYGPAEPSFGDTLQAVRGHAYVDPLAEPGSADLTSHVQFSDLAQKARTAGLAVEGPITQAEFLGRLGIVERTARLMALNPSRAADLEAATQRLMSPGGMGQLFKVLAVRSPALPAPPPFG